MNTEMGIHIHEEHGDRNVVCAERCDVPVPFEEHRPVRKKDNNNSPAESEMHSER